MNENYIKDVIQKVVAEHLSNSQECSDETANIPVEISARHIHLSDKDVELLFGKGYSLTFKRELSQPGQFLAEERINIVTSKSEFRNVAILGPTRKETQLELSATDARQLGINAPVRQSGDIKDSASVCVLSEKSAVIANSSTIIAQNHIHMNPSDAKRLDVCDGQKVKVRMNTKRPLVFEDVIVRVNDAFDLAMHIDFDEANACMLGKNDTGTIIK